MNAPATSAASSSSSSPPAAEVPFQPFVPASESPRELTVRGVLLGSLLGVIFAASSVYLGLKVGLTVSASIPVAVLSITLFRWLQRALNLAPASILENNVVQTVGSAGESIAAGVAFTLPSLLLMGFELELARILLVALLGGLIGVLMMIPLREGLIVKEHGKLSYPEGTACADVLIVGEQGGTNAKTVFLGFFIGGGYAIMNLILGLWSDTSAFVLDFWGRLKGGTLSFEVSPPMLGVGYIIGPKVAANMFAGGMLSFVVLVPLIRFFGDGLSESIYPATLLIREMNPYQLRNAYILYIGAGAVATGGFIALGRAIPTIFGAFRGSMQTLRAQRGQTASSAVRRTERDLPMSFVLGGAGLLVLAIWLAPVLEINLVSAILIMLFGFFFVTVSSRITGEIGSSSNPISGMTVATLLITCGLFVAMGWTGVGYKAMALSTAALVCVAASNGGTTSQDLKTGFLVGSTPRAQQIAILVGVLSSAIAIGFVLEQLNRGATTHRAVSFPSYVAASSENVSDLTAKMENGPDGRSYKVLFVKADIALAADNGAAEASIVRGKYLVDETGHIAYLVDPGVCGTYPLRWEKPAAAVGAVDISKAAPELGPDRVAYRRVDLEAASYLVDDAGVVAYVARPVAKFDAPKAQLFRLIIDGTLGGKLPWALVLVGVLLAIMMELVGVAALPFAVGLYLPISTSAAIFVGGLVRLLVDKKREGAGAEFSPGMLMASGLIAGGAITGVVQSVIETMPNVKHALDFSGAFPLAGIHSWWPLVPFLAMAAVLYVVGAGRSSNGDTHGGGA